MKNLCILMCFCSLLLAACTPDSTTTTAPVVPTFTPTDKPTLTPVPQGETMVVTTTSDSGPGSLRQTLLEALSYDTIIFDPDVFPPDAPATIAVLTELPHVHQSNLTLDASQAGAIIDGSQASGEWVAGLQIVSSEANTIQGLQISNFSGPGIAISGDAKNNYIGGDRSLGAGPFGQGNLISLNGIGIDLSTSGTTLNTITGNLVGTDTTGANELGNIRSGITISEGAHGNTIGPDNLIAFNGGAGVEIYHRDTLHNTITKNCIHENIGPGINLMIGGNAGIVAPYLMGFDSSAGIVSGTTCPDCTVEVFTDGGDEGAVYQGFVAADGNGFFTFNMDVSDINTNITTTSTDADGNTSSFSRSAGLTRGVVSLQDGNSLPGYSLLPRTSSQLADNRVGMSYAGAGMWIDIPYLDGVRDEITDFGAKRVDSLLYEIEPPIDWSGSEYDIPPEFDKFIADLNEHGVAFDYVLHFWDKAGYARGEELSTPRFKTDEQIQDFLDYVRFVVGHFKDRIQYYTIWSEPDNCNPPKIKCIEPGDYINLSMQTIPIIRQEDPRAKIALAPNVLFFGREYLFTILRSEVISMFDVIQWHGIYDVAPNIGFYGNYYYEYPLIIEEIKQTASAHGFQGEYWGTELTWCSEEFPSCHPSDQPWGQQKTDLLAAKYYARGIVMHLGMDMAVGIGGFQNTATWSYPTIRNLNTVMAGATPDNLSVDIESEVTNFMSYGFISNNGDLLFALWTNGTAIEEDPGIKTTLSFPNLIAEKITGIDVLNGFEQELIATKENGSMVIRNLLVKDYPIIIRLTNTTYDK